MLYAAGLLVGACLGGNITPIGASCNVVAVGVLRRQGHKVTFRQFARIGLPFTLVATLAGYLFIWVFWS
jgi:Na+/H+ antiporter NhaD/arsenite permease-like protein